MLVLITQIMTRCRVTSSLSSQGTSLTCLLFFLYSYFLIFCCFLYFGDYNIISPFLFSLQTLLYITSYFLYFKFIASEIRREEIFKNLGFGMDIFLPHLAASSDPSNLKEAGRCSAQKRQAKESSQSINIFLIETSDSGFQRKCWGVKGPQSQFSSLWINSSVFYASVTGWWEYRNTGLTLMWDSSRSNLNSRSSHWPGCNIFKVLLDSGTRPNHPCSGISIVF